MPKSEDTDRPEIDANDEVRTPGFSRALAGKIIALALFICLGTFAVAQTVMSSKSSVSPADKTEQVADANPDSTGKVIEQTTAKAPVIGNVIPASLNDTSPPSRPKPSSGLTASAGTQSTQTVPPTKKSPSKNAARGTSNLATMPQRSTSSAPSTGLKKPNQPPTSPNTGRTPAAQKPFQPTVQSQRKPTDNSFAPLKAAQPSRAEKTAAQKTAAPSSQSGNSFMPAPRNSASPPATLPSTRPAAPTRQASTNSSPTKRPANNDKTTPGGNITQNDLRAARTPANNAFPPSTGQTVQSPSPTQNGNRGLPDILGSPSASNRSNSASAPALPPLPTGSMNRQANPSSAPSQTASNRVASGDQRSGTIPPNLMPVNPQPTTAFDRTRQPSELPTRSTAAPMQSGPTPLANLSGGATTGPSETGQSRQAIQPQTPSNFARQIPQRPAPNSGFSGSNNPAKPTQLPGARSTTNELPAPFRSARSPRGQMPNAQGNRSPVNTPSPRIQTVSATRVAPTPGDSKLQGPQAPTVTIQKIGPSEIQVNTPAEFQLLVRNNGATAVHDVVVLDRVPSGARLVKSMPTANPDSTGLLTWNLGSLEPGAEKRIEMQLLPTRPGEMGSVAQVSFSAQASSRTRVTQPILKIHHTGPSKVLIGETVSLEITVSNEGDGPATRVLIQEDVPPELQFQDGFRELEYEVGTLEPGQSRTIQLALAAAKVGRVRNTVVATAEGDLSDQHAIEMEVVAPKLVLSGSGPSRRYLNRDATHEFQITNNGTAVATNVELMAKLPPGLKFLNANNQGVYEPGTHAVYWSLAELGQGQSAKVQLTTTPVEPGQQTIQFIADADLEQHAEYKHSLAVEHLVDVFFDIDDVVDPIEIGSETTYRLRIVNQGTRASNNIELTVAFPEGLQPVGVEGHVANQIVGQQVRFAPITSLNPGDEIRLTVRARGTRAGDHRVAANLQADGREINVTKEESTRVYRDR